MYVEAVKPEADWTDSAFRRAPVLSSCCSSSSPDWWVYFVSIPTGSSRFFTSWPPAKKTHGTWSQSLFISPRLLAAPMPRSPFLLRPLDDLDVRGPTLKIYEHNFIDRGRGGGARANEYIQGHSSQEYIYIYLYIFIYIYIYIYGLQSRGVCHYPDLLRSD